MDQKSFRSPCIRATIPSPDIIDSCGRIVFSTLCCIAGHSELGAWKAYGDPCMDFGDIKPEGGSVFQIVLSSGRCKEC